MQKVLENSNIDQIIVSEFKRELRENGTISLTDNSRESNAEFQFEVIDYGLDLHKAFTSTVYPTLQVNCTLRNKNGEIIWQKFILINSIYSDNPIGYKTSEYLNDNELIKNVFMNAAADLSRRLVDNF